MAGTEIIKLKDGTKISPAGSSEGFTMHEFWGRNKKTIKNIFSGLIGLICTLLTLFIPSIQSAWLSAILAGLAGLLSTYGSVLLLAYIDFKYSDVIIEE
jgi:hypothetical protein